MRRVSLHCSGQFTQSLSVVRGVRLALRGVVAVMGGLHAQHRRLKRIEPEVPAHELVVVLRLAAVRAEDLRLFIQGIVVAHHCTSVTKAAKIF